MFLDSAFHLKSSPRMRVEGIVVPNSGFSLAILSSETYQHIRTKLVWRHLITNMTSSAFSWRHQRWLIESLSLALRVIIININSYFTINICLEVNIFRGGRSFCPFVGLIWKSLHSHSETFHGASTSSLRTRLDVLIIECGRTSANLNPIFVSKNTMTTVK